MQMGLDLTRGTQPISHLITLEEYAQDTQIRLMTAHRHEDKHSGRIYQSRYCI